MSGISWAEMKLRHDAGAVSAYCAAALPQTVAGRVEQVHMLMNYPVVDEETGEVEYVQLISTDTARRLLDGIGDKP